MPPIKLTTEHRRGVSLTRSLGAQEQITADVFSFAFTDESALVMGCDGFWEHVPSESVGQLLTGRPPFCVAEELGNMALVQGSQDNVSVIVAEGESFVARYAAEQITEYASALAQYHEADAVSRCRLLLEFSRSYLSDPRVSQVIDQLQARLPKAAMPQPSMARPVSAEKSQPINREQEYLDHIGKLESQLVELEANLKAINRELRNQQEQIVTLQTQLDTARRSEETQRKRTCMLGEHILGLWETYPEHCEYIFKRDWLVSLQDWVLQQKAIRQTHNP